MVIRRADHYKHFLVLRTPFFRLPSKNSIDSISRFVVRRVSRVSTWKTRVQKHVSITSGHADFKTQTNSAFFATNNTNYISDCCVWKPETCPISLPYTFYTGIVMLIPVWKVRYVSLEISSSYIHTFAGQSWNFSHYIKETHCYWIHTTRELISIVKYSLRLKRLGF